MDADGPWTDLFRYKFHWRCEIWLFDVLFPWCREHCPVCSRHWCISLCLSEWMHRWMNASVSGGFLLAATDSTGSSSRLTITEVDKIFKHQVRDGFLKMSTVIPRRLFSYLKYSYFSNNIFIKFWRQHILNLFQASRLSTLKGFPQTRIMKKHN